MTANTGVHTCSYYCERPECIKRQRDELRDRMEAALAKQPAAGDGCHCGTCTCDPNMAPAVRFDLSPAQMEGAIREHLIRLGWTPPDEHAVSQPAAPSETVNVIGMPEFDSLLDHIYEYGTAAECVVERANAFARAVLAQYAPQQPAGRVHDLAARLVDELDGLVGESDGVSGLHLNGDVATWDELLPGGRFERLSSLDELRAALAAQQQGGAE